MLRTRIFVILAVLLVTCAGQAQTWNAATQFSGVVNPNGSWSYGTLTSFGGTFSTFPNQGNFGGLEVWADFGYDSFMSAIRNATGTLAYHQFGTSVIPAGQLVIHPGPAGEYTVVRWTAPANNLYHISALFTGLDDYGGTTTDVHVLLNGGPIYNGTINGFLDFKSFAAPVSMSTGDTLDFVVGYGANGNYLYDSTGLNALISTSPGPSNITTQMRVTRQSTRWNASTHLYEQRVTLTNDGSALSGPVYLVLDSLSQGAVLANMNGLTANSSPIGSPYMLVRSGPWPSGLDVSVMLLFGRAGDTKIDYTPRVLGGPGVP